MNDKAYYSLGIDIGSTTVKIAILNNDNEVLPYKTVFSIKNSKGK